jgi:hypothetical protein
MNRKRHSSPWGALALGLAVSALAFSCEMSSGLLSDSERSSLYTLTINTKDGTAIADGTVVYPGTELAVFVAKRSGAGDPATLDFSLDGQDGSSVAALRFVSAAVDSSKANAAAIGASKSVASIDGHIAGFQIPAGQSSGAYQLAVAITGPDGSVLQRETMSIFIGRAKPGIDSVSVFPPAVEPGDSVLLGLNVTWVALAPPDASGALSKETGDPWIRWSRDGSVFAEGLQSAGFAKVVWTAPRIEGAYSIRAEVFPATPAKGKDFTFRASASQDLRVMVIAAAYGSGNDFADSLSFYSLLKFDGSFDDSGTRPRNAQPESFGSPSLDIYPSGFGYRFGAQAGVRLPGLMPPSASGRLAAFAVLVRLDPDHADGVIVSFSSADASYALVLGLKDGKPYVESQVAGRSQRSVAFSAVPPGPLTLEAIFKPEGDALSISWRAEGERIEAPSLPLPPSPPVGSATLGGALSLPGVYDGFGLIIAGAASAYPSPTYRLASRRRWKSSLVIAEGFEDGQLPPSSSAVGSAAVSDHGLVLGPGASLALSPAFGIGAGLVVEANIEGDRDSCLLDFSTPEGARAFAVRGTGEVLDATGKTIGSFPVSGTMIRFSLEQRDGRLYLVGAGGAPALDILGSAKRFALSLKRAEGTLAAAFDRILVHSISAATNA